MAEVKLTRLPPPDPPDADALRALHTAGAHFVLCRAHDEGAKKAKSALHRGWQTAAPLLDAVIEHRGRGGLVGMMPGSIGAVVIDLDPDGDTAPVAAPPATGNGAIVNGTDGRAVHLNAAAVAALTSAPAPPLGAPVLQHATPSRWWRALLVQGAARRDWQPEVGAHCRRAARGRHSRRPWLCDPLESGRRRGGP